MAVKLYRYATIGTFDGVHAGHRLVLRKLTEEADRAVMASVAFVFRNHPLSVIAPERAPRQLMSYEEKCRIIESMGVEVIPVDFNEHLRSMKSEDFMRYIRDKYGVKGIVVGYDNKFGSDLDATYSQYVEYAHELGLYMAKADDMEGVSSTIIRKHLAQGLVEEANAKLGRLYSVTGKVVTGKQLGRNIGFPTANVEPTNQNSLIPMRGVYAVKVSVGGIYTPLSGVLNIGVRPTVDGDSAPTSIEVHILDFTDDVYGKRIKVEFVSRMRDEKRFASLQELKTAIETDCKSARYILEEYERMNRSRQSEQIIY